MLDRCNETGVPIPIGRALKAAANGAAKAVANRAAFRVAAATEGLSIKSIGHPATSEIDYKSDEMAFMAAMERFKNATGKKFPTWTEVLGVVRGMGYVLPS